MVKILSTDNENKALLFNSQCIILRPQILVSEVRKSNKEERILYTNTNIQWLNIYINRC